MRYRAIFSRLGLLFVAFAITGAALGTMPQAVSAAACAPSTTNFCNANAIAFPNPNGPSSNTPGLYASPIAISSFAPGTTITHITVTLYNTNIQDFDQFQLEAALQGPNGKTFMFLHATDGACPQARGIDFSFADDGTKVLADENNATTPNCTSANGAGPYDAFEAGAIYQPRAYTSGLINPIPGDGGTGTITPDLAAPGGSSTFASEFNGTDPNGTWKLFLYNVDNTVGPGSIDGGWGITFTTSNAPPTTTTLSSNLNPSFTANPSGSVVFTATVTSSSIPVITGGVTFFDGATALAGTDTTPIPVNGSGQATLSTIITTEGHHVITARYNGTASFAQSTSAAVNQYVNNHTVVTGTNYANPGTIATPNTGDQINEAAATPYPSNIFVTGRTGIVSGVVVHLNNVNSANINGADMLLVGPNGEQMLIFSRVTGGTLSAATNATIVLSDAAASSVPTTALSGTNTYKPTARPPGAGLTVNFPAPNVAPGTNPPSAPYNTAAPAGAATLNGIFNGQPNGTWSLYVAQSNSSTTTIGGWSLDITTQTSDLTIAKSHTGNFRQGQTGATYTLTASNTGPLPTSGAVTVVDTLPAGLTATALTGTGWSCDVPTLTCTRSDALANGASYPAITLTVNVAANAPASVTNSVTVSGGGESNTANDTATDPTTVDQVADLTIAKTHSGNFRQGDTADSYTITASNAVGSGPTVGTVTVVDTLPTGLTATALSGTGWTCDLPTFTCTRSDALTGGSSYPPITLTVSVAANAPASVTNSVTVSGGGELNTANDTASDPTTVDQVADLTIAKSHTGNFRQGDAADTYTITASNAAGFGPTVGTVTVVETLPTGLTPIVVGGTGWLCGGLPLTCTRSDALTGGSSYPPITLYVAVAGNAPASVTNSVTVSGGGELNTANDTATDSTTVDQAADLTITKSHTGNFRQGQTGATYTLTASNAAGFGPTVGTVTIVDTLPTGLTATALSGTGWTCDLPTLTCTRSDALTAGSSYSAITLTVSVANNAATSVTNQAAVSGGGELNTANDTATDPTTVDQAADLTITKSHTGNFAQGDVGDTYTVTASNAGPGPTVGTVTVVDTLPTGLTATALSGTGWTCDLPTLTCTRSDVLPAAGIYPAITLTVTVAGNAPASVTNSVTVSGGGELNTANDTATDPTTVNPAPDLTITKTHTGNFRQGQTGATYTITVANAGTGATHAAVTTTDTLPTGLTATALGGTGWTCTLGTLSCTRSDALAGGSSYPAITLTVNVANNAPASVTNQAAVSGGGEVNTSNDSASDATTIDQVADLTIVKSHTGLFVRSQSGSYTMTVSNAAGSGPTVGTVTVVDTLPSGLTATALSGTGWTCDLPTLTCTRTDALAGGASYPPITLTVSVAANAAATVTNAAAVSGGGELNTANDTASDPTTTSAGQVTQITINGLAAHATEKVGSVVQLTATATYQDGTSQDVTTQVIWTSSDPNLATVDSSGKATFKVPGSVVFTATLGSVSGTMQVTITPPTPIGIAPAPAPAGRPAAAGTSPPPVTAPTAAPTPAPAPSPRP